MKWPFNRDQVRSVRLGTLFVLIFLVDPFSPSAPARSVQPFPNEGPNAKRESQPAPTPFVQREEVRFVTLDLVVEQRGGTGGAGWHLARDLVKEKVHILVGSREIELDLFENWCSEVTPGSSPATVMTAASEGDSSSRAPSGPTTIQSREGSAEEQNSPPSEPHKYILYFDLQQLTMGGRNRAFQAALEWAKKASQSSDEVMILTGGMSLRIVRPMLPASRNLMEDLAAARDDTSAMDMWAEGEERRIEEIVNGGGPALAKLYTSIDYDIARRSLENISRLMTIFGDIPGTKDLVYFSETIRLYPGSEYPFGPSPKTALSMDVARPVYELAALANEGNVRIYAVQASGLKEGKNIEDPLLVLSEETGGRPVYGTNSLDAVFGRIEEDHSCFYRVGFRLPSENSGSRKTIVVRIGESGRGYRVRHRRSVDDSTREKKEMDRLTAAFLIPEAARAFPVEVSPTRLFDHARGSRVRIDVSVPAESLLVLPAGDPKSLQMTVQFGGQVVPLRVGSASMGKPEGNPWGDVDPKRETFTFNRQAQIQLPPSRAISHRPTQIVYAIEMDVPPGDYRAVVAVQDVRSGSVAAQLSDFHAEASEVPLGEIGIGLEDVATVIVQAPDPTEKLRPLSGKAKSKIQPAENSLPPQLLLVHDATVELNAVPSFFYAVCDPQAALKNGGQGNLAEQEALAGWRVRRVVACGGKEGIALPPHKVADVSPRTGCALMIDELPAESLKAGPCRFEVGLEWPGADSVMRSKEFFVVSTNGPSTVSAVSPVVDR